MTRERTTTLTAAERGREVRQRLLQAAAELIAERGWTAVSTRMLAERASVAPGLVHYHFASLQALLTEAALGVTRQAVNALASMLDDASLEEGLRHLLGALDHYTGRDAMSLLFVETYLAANRDGDLRRDLAAIVADFLGRFGRWLDQRGVANPAETAAVLTAAIDGIMLHRALNPDVTAVRVVPVLQRMLTPAATRRRRDREKGEDR